MGVVNDVAIYGEACTALVTEYNIVRGTDMVKSALEM